MRDVHVLDQEMNQRPFGFQANALTTKPGLCMGQGSAAVLNCHQSVPLMLVFSTTISSLRREGFSQLQANPALNNVRDMDQFSLIMHDDPWQLFYDNE